MRASCQTRASRKAAHVRPGLTLLAALIQVWALGWSAAQSEVTFAFVASVAARLNLKADVCPPVLAGMFVEDVTLICYQHSFSAFGSFEAAWESAAVWQGRFVQIESWVTYDAPSGETHISLFRLDGDGILVLFAPGVPGPLALLINDISKLGMPPAASESYRDSGPKRVFDALGATTESEALANRGTQFPSLDRHCQTEDIACTASLIGRSAIATMGDLDLAEYGWRIQNIGGDTVYSTVDGNLLIILAESSRGVTVTAVRLDRGLEGAPFIPGP